MASGNVVSNITYLQRLPLYLTEKPFQLLFGETNDHHPSASGCDTRDSNVEFESLPRTIHDIRDVAYTSTLDDHGFRVVAHTTACTSFTDRRVVESVYFAEVERLLRDVVEGGYDRVCVFDYRVRKTAAPIGSEMDLSDPTAWLRPVPTAHVDQSDRGVLSRVQAHTGDDWPFLVRGRVRLINIWRPLDHAVEDYPLAFCDPATMPDEDLVETDYIRRRYRGTMMYAQASEGHRWCYLGNHRPDEVLAMKMFDSVMSVKARRLAHASFRHPFATKDSKPRTSIEVRALVFNYPKEEEASDSDDSDSDDDSPLFHNQDDDIVDQLPQTLILRGSGSSAGAEMPRLIYGTAWKKEKTADMVYRALRAGFRAVDTAAQPRHYREDLVGEGIRRAISEGIVSREEIFIQAKFTPPDSQDADSSPYDVSLPIDAQVHASITSSLKNLSTLSEETPYLDCVVLHTPYASEADTLTAWRTLATHVPHEIRHLGVSNCPLSIVNLLNAELVDGGSPSLAVVQNSLHHPRVGFNASLRKYCRDAGIAYQTFGALSKDPTLLTLRSSRAVARIVEHVNGVTAPVALYALVLGLGGSTAVLSGTSDEEHMVEDVEGLEKVTRWAGSEGGRRVWEKSLDGFRRLIGEL